MTEYSYGFRVLGDCRQPRRLVDADSAILAYAACDPRCQPDRESYLSIFRFGGDFREHVERTSSTKGFNGPCWAEWLWWDIDRENDLGRARDDARRLVVALTGRFGLDDGDVLCFWSGGKGCHIGAPTSPWEPAPGLDFHRTARRFAESVAEGAGIQIDTGIYDKSRCFRAPNSKHPKTGLHKRRLSVDELMHLSVDAILKLAERPVEFDLPKPTHRSEAVAQLWTESTEQIRQETDAKTARLATGSGCGRLNRATLEFIHDGATAGDRHRLLYSAAANLAELGAPFPLCVALLEESALDCGLTPSDVRRAIENGCASVQPGAKPGANA